MLVRVSDAARTELRGVGVATVGLLHAEDIFYLHRLKNYAISPCLWAIPPRGKG